MDSKPNKLSDHPITRGEWIGLLLTPLIIGLLYGLFMRNDVASFYAAIVSYLFEIFIGFPAVAVAKYKNWLSFSQFLLQGGILGAVLGLGFVYLSGTAWIDPFASLSVIVFVDFYVVMGTTIFWFIAYFLPRHKFPSKEIDGI